MKIRRIPFAVLPLLLAASFAAAQDAAPPPPVRMGLWQSETTTSAEGMADSPLARAMTANGRTTVTQGCLTPDTWKKGFQDMQQRRKDVSCNVSNFQQSTHQVSFDEACGADGGYSTRVHFEMLIDDPENAHGHADIRMSGPPFPQGMTMHMIMKTKFLSPSCGDVKPGEGKVVRP